MKEWFVKFFMWYILTLTLLQSGNPSQVIQNHKLNRTKHKHIFLSPQQCYKLIERGMNKFDLNDLVMLHNKYQKKLTTSIKETKERANLFTTTLDELANKKGNSKGFRKNYIIKSTCAPKKNHGHDRVEDYENDYEVVEINSKNLVSPTSLQLQNSSIVKYRTASSQNRTGTTFSNIAISSGEITKQPKTNYSSVKKKEKENLHCSTTLAPISKSSYLKTEQIKTSNNNQNVLNQIKKPSKTHRRLTFGKFRHIIDPIINESNKFFKGKYNNIKNENNKFLFAGITLTTEDNKLNSSNKPINEKKLLRHLSEKIIKAKKSDANMQSKNNQLFNHKLKKHKEKYKNEIVKKLKAKVPESSMDFSLNHSPGSNSFQEVEVKLKDKNSDQFNTHLLEDKNYNRKDYRLISRNPKKLSIIGKSKNKLKEGRKLHYENDVDPNENASFEDMFDNFIKSLAYEVSSKMSIDETNLGEQSMSESNNGSTITTIADFTENVIDNVTDTSNIVTNMLDNITDNIIDNVTDNSNAITTSNNDIIEISETENITSKAECNSDKQNTINETLETHVMTTPYLINKEISIQEISHKVGQNKTQTQNSTFHNIKIPHSRDDSIQILNITQVYNLYSKLIPLKKYLESEDANMYPQLHQEDFQYEETSANPWLNFIQTDVKNEKDFSVLKAILENLSELARLGQYNNETEQNDAKDSSKKNNRPFIILKRSSDFSFE